jgi:hypothetical protein
MFSGRLTDFSCGLKALSFCVVTFLNNWAGYLSFLIVIQCLEMRQAVPAFAKFIARSVQMSNGIVNGIVIVVAWRPPTRWHSARLS